MNVAVCVKRKLKFSKQTMTLGKHPIEEVNTLTYLIQTNSFNIQCKSIRNEVDMLPSISNKERPFTKDDNILYLFGLRHR